MNIFYYIIYNLKVQHSEIQSCPMSSTLYARNTAVKNIIWLLEKKSYQDLRNIPLYVFII